MLGKTHIIHQNDTEKQIISGGHYNLSQFIENMYTGKILKSEIAPASEEIAPGSGKIQQDQEPFFGSWSQNC